MKPFSPDYTIEDCIIFFKTVYGHTYRYDAVSLGRAAFKEKLAISKSKHVDMDPIYEWINTNYANGKIKRVNHVNAIGSNTELKWTWVEENNSKKTLL